MSSAPVLVNEVDEFRVASHAWPFSSMRCNWSVEAVRRSQLFSSSILAAGLVTALLMREADVGIAFAEARLWWAGLPEALGNAGEEVEVMMG